MKVFTVHKEYDYAEFSIDSVWDIKSGTENRILQIKHEDKDKTVKVYDSLDFEEHELRT